jgi:type III pantothenate kinase
MDLVLDIGNYRIKGAYFDEGGPLSPFVLPHTAASLEPLLDAKRPAAVCLSSTHSLVDAEIKALLEKKGIPFSEIDFKKVKVVLDVDEPEALGQDRIANVYGALYHFPQNDCIVVDMGTAVTFDVIGCDGRYLGGAIYPGVDIGAKALANYTDQLPEVTVTAPVEPIAKTTETHIQSGLYYGLLGAVERIVFEMRHAREGLSDVKVLATGGIFRQIEDARFVEEMGELVDLIDPILTLIGLHEIMKENQKDV